MKLSALLVTTAITCAMVSPLPAIAQNAGSHDARPSSNETAASGQQFEHPSDDVSYAKDMRDDEKLAKAKAVDNGKVRYISGGIADSGMRAIDTEEHLYNLKMLFVSQGEYLADVNVKITDHKGNTVLDTKTKGPVLLVKMHPGHYTVSTTADGGSTLTRKVTVGEDYLASYVLRYPASEQ